MSKIILAEQASAPDTPGADKVAIFVDANGDLAWKDDAGNVTKIAAAGSYTLTIPATGTAALLGTAQTFSAVKTFDNVLVAPGMKPAADSTTALQLQKSNGTAVVTIDTTNGIVLLDKLQIGAATAQLYRYAAGVMRQQIEGVSLANNATMIVNNDSAYGLVWVFNQSDGPTGLIGVAGGAGTLIYGSGAAFSGTAGNAGTVNVYGSGGKVYVENKRGATKTLAVWSLG